jgi:hypothetical protein
VNRKSSQTCKLRKTVIDNLGEEYIHGEVAGDKCYNCEDAECEFFPIDLYFSMIVTIMSRRE